jgi:hypothetical protein
MIVVPQAPKVVRRGRVGRLAPVNATIAVRVVPVHAVVAVVPVAREGTVGRTAGPVALAVPTVVPTAVPVVTVGPTVVPMIAAARLRNVARATRPNGARRP